MEWVKLLPIAPWVLIALIVSVTDVAYHYGYKSAAGSVNPFVYIAYMNAGIVVMALLCAWAMKVWGLGDGPVHFWIGTGWMFWALLISVVVLVMEGAIMFTYMVGAPFSLANSLMSVLIAALTLVVGYCVFGDRLTIVQMVGLVFCVVGAVCIAYQGEKGQSVATNTMNVDRG